jgi:isoquinoline 1-oxidoreductase subunit beta
MQNTTSIDRRSFLRLSGITGAALVLGFNAKSNGIPAILNLSNRADLYELTPYVIIEKSGQITIMNPKPEMGQGTYQSVPALIAEELEVPLEKVIIKQTQGEKEFGGWQGAGGSSSVRGSYFQLRKVGASARAMLIGAAAAAWKVPASECYADNARIIHKPSGKSLGYSDLVEAAASLKVPENPELKDPKDFKILGKSAPRLDIPLKVSGKAVFGIDAEVPGMVYASVERCPVFGSKLVSYDDTDALKVKGVLKVVKTVRVMGKNRYDGIAVVAEIIGLHFRAGRP